ncbi:MAG TPA: SBBP repeat-containing protein [Ignavibacteria bacterium]|jgi:uncharacterized delta-60 repeat protein
MKKIILILFVTFFAYVSYAEIVSRVLIYNGPANGLDQCNGIVQDKFGKVYVTGVSWGGTTKEDYATVKFSEDGDFVWAVRFDGAGHNLDYASAMAIDVEGNIYVTGWSRQGTTLTTEDYCTIKYNSNGQQQWVRFYDGGTGLDCEYYDHAVAIFVDNLSNVYVTGYSINSSNNEDYATVKYNKDGVQQWVKRYNGPNGLNDKAFAIVVDNSGNVYVTGASQATGKGYDYLTVKYSSTGTQLWTARYDASSGDDMARSLKVFSDGSVFITGSSYGGTTNKLDYATVKYNSSGVQQWLKRYNGSANDTDIATSLDLDIYGNPYVTGTAKNTTTGYDYYTIQYYGFDGGIGWTKQYASNSSNLSASDKAWKVKVVSKPCAAGPLDIPCWVIDVYVTGQSEAVSTGYDYVTLRYLEDGTQRWENRFNGSGSSFDAAYEINVRDNYPYVYIGGILNNNYGVIGIAESREAGPLSINGMSTNYPNPFNPETNIYVELIHDSYVKLVIYDALGREVTRLADNELKEGSHSFIWNASGSTSGIYFYRLETNYGSETKKIVLIK